MEFKRKAMKNLKYRIIAPLAIIMMFITSCDQDVSVPKAERFNSTNALVVEESITVSEGGDPSFTIQQEGLIDNIFDEAEAFYEVSGQIGIRVVGGTAIEGEDYEFNLFLISDFSPYLLQGGYYYEYDASLSLDNLVNGIINVIDDGESEGAETIELEFFPCGIGSVVINDRLTININD